jgi:ABC-type uncharacterized transport system permease subunit
LAELLFWPALIAYSEAAVAYAGNARHPGRAGRFATWGVRVGWLAQTGLLAVQAERSDGFPWDTWAGSLNLFVWLVITAYLFWGCDSRYRLLGLAVLPPAVCLLVAAWLGGATRTHPDGTYSSAFLVLHVGLVLAAFAGFTVSAGLAALYLWQERRLKLRRAGALLGRAPSLVQLDALEGRVIAFAVPALTAGIVAGFVRLRSHGGSVDALMVVTVLTWALFTGYLVLRHAYSWRGRRAAYVVLAGFALVAVARLALPLTHFA